MHVNSTKSRRHLIREIFHLWYYIIRLIFWFSQKYFQDKEESRGDWNKVSVISCSYHCCNYSLLLFSGRTLWCWNIQSEKQDDENETMYFLIICCECVHWETVIWLPYDLSSSYFWFKLYLPDDFRSTPITLASTFCCVLYLLLCLKQPLVWAVLCVSLWLKPLLLLMRALPITMTWASLAVCCTYPYNISSFLCELYLPLWL